MKLIKKIKQWRDRRFQKRVLNALDATIDARDKAIVFNKTVRSREDIQSINLCFSKSDGTMHGKLADAPTLDIDAIHNTDSGVPV